MAGVEDFLYQENEEWRLDVQNNLAYLTQNIGDLLGILTRLIQHNIVSESESEVITNEYHHPTIMARNGKLLSTLKAKGWSRIKLTFMQILRETLNDNCADMIEHHSIHPTKCAKTSRFTNAMIKTLLNGTIKSKWWPEELRLPNSFFERKIANVLLTDKLKKILTQNENTVTVINRQVAISGLGGIGKTTTAKSFAIKNADDYDLIIWIDCGEGRLLKSLTKIARDLRLEDRNELELKELACRSFEILKDCRCLFIFDNAECYSGKEGIREVLPKNHNNFHVIITSRNRHWGQENIDGTISEFQLNVFGEDEGVEFAERNIKNFHKTDEIKIKALCNLLSYLPLALQIAVSTLNKYTISLDKYIHELITTDDILHSTLDDYERTIHKTLKITLELIQNHERKHIGEIATQILSIFGYITPDAVDSNFFMAVNLQKNEEIEEATNLLQFYSIISKSTLRGRCQLSIHRLFQQVIRHNTKGTQKQILQQIFTCDGFLDYKPIPFMYYADKELQKEFPKLKLELIDKLELSNLLKERRYQEAAELSRLIKDYVQTPASVFNFALCLKYNNDRDEAKKILQQIFTETKRKESTNEICVNHFKFPLDSNKELLFDYVAWNLFLVYCEENNEDDAIYIFRSVKQMSLRRCSFNSSVMSLLPASLQKLELLGCTISKCSSTSFLGVQLPLQLKELTLWDNEFMDDDGKKFTSIDISHLIPLNLTRLEIENSIECVSLKRLIYIPFVELEDCSLIIIPGIYITPEEISLRNIKFVTANNERIPNVLVNDFVQFREMKKLHLDTKGMSINLCDAFTFNDLYLNNTNVLDWIKSNWKASKLRLWEVDFVAKTSIEVTEMKIYYSLVKISVLPSTTQLLMLEGCTLVDFPVSPLQRNKMLPHLCKLCLKDIKINCDKNYVNKDDVFRFLVPNWDKWVVKKDQEWNYYFKNCERVMTL